MNDDIRALLTMAASGAPAAPALPADMPGRVRRRRAGRIAVTVTTAAALVVGSVAVAGRLARSVDTAATDCGGSWVDASFDVPSNAYPDRLLTPNTGVVVGPDDIWLTAYEPGGPDGKGSSAIVQGDGQSWRRRDLPDGANAQISVLAADGPAVWAAGYRTEYEASTQATILHPVLYRWGGSAWLSESLPVMPESSAIWALAVRGNRIVAGGSTTTAERRAGAWYQAEETAFLIERAGSRWHARPLPDLRGDYSVRQIVIGADGRLVVLTSGRGGVGVLVEDGDGWRIATPPGKPIVLASIRSAAEIWAVRPFVVADDHVELLRYDGDSWSVRRIALAGMDHIESLSAGAPGEAWLTAVAPVMPPLRMPGRSGLSRFGRTEIFHITETVAKESVAWPGEHRRVLIAEVDGAGRGLALGSVLETNSERPLVLTRCAD